MSSLKSFFKENAEVVLNVEYIVSNRFKDESGNPIAWMLRPVTSKEFDDITNRANKTKFAKGKREVKFDMSTFKTEFCVAGVVYPDLKDAELQKSYGVMGAPELLQEMLAISGEMNSLYDKINEISGFDKDINDLKEEAKN